MKITGQIITGLAITQLCSINVLADVTVASYGNPYVFDFHVNYMPDYDQKRVNLENQGDFYCVPTASMNLLQYAANWGFPQIDPGPGYWQGMDHYYEMGAEIDQLGMEMNTDASGGTGMNGWYTALQGRLNPHDFVVTKFTSSDSTWPSLNHMAQQTAAGAIVSFAYGRYEYTENAEWGTLDLTERKGGHAVTLMHMHSDGASNPIELWSRDPADDGDVFSQSSFNYRIYDNVVRKQVTIEKNGEIKPYSHVIALGYPSDDGKVRLIDSFISIMPPVELSFNTVQVNVNLLGDKSFSNGIPELQKFPMPLGFSLNDAEFHPDYLKVVTLENSDHAYGSVIRAINRNDGTREELGKLGKQASKIVFGRNRLLYVLTENSIMQVNIDQGFEVMAETFLQQRGSEIIYNDASDQVVVVSNGIHKLVSFNSNLTRTSRIEYDLPEDISSARNVNLAVNPQDGLIAVSAENSGKIYLVSLEQGKAMIDELIVSQYESVGSMQFNNQGHLIALIGRSRSEFEKSKSGQWKAVINSKYAKVGPIGQFRLAHSRTNELENEYSMDQWYNIPPDELLNLGTVVKDETSKVTKIQP